jgi:hypothetical protein
MHWSRRRRLKSVARKKSRAGGRDAWKYNWRLLLGLEVVEEDAALLGLLTPITDDDARAVDNLASIAFTIELA